MDRRRDEPEKDLFMTKKENSGHAYFCSEDGGHAYFPLESAAAVMGIRPSTLRVLTHEPMDKLKISRLNDGNYYVDSNNLIEWLNRRLSSVDHHLNELRAEFAEKETCRKEVEA
jgi:hypothetical protein